MKTIINNLGRMYVLWVFLCVFTGPTQMGCASWQKTTHGVLVGLVEASDAAHLIGSPILDAQCQKRALECNSVGDMACNPLRSCQENRRLLNSMVMGVQAFCATGFTALSVDKQTTVDEYISKAMELFKTLDVFVKRLKGE